MSCKSYDSDLEIVTGEHNYKNGQCIYCLRNEWDDYEDGLPEYLNRLQVINELSTQPKE